MADRWMWGDDKWAAHYAKEIKKARAEQWKLQIRGTLTPAMTLTFEKQIAELEAKREAHAARHQEWLVRRDTIS